MLGSTLAKKEFSRSPSYSFTIENKNIYFSPFLSNVHFYQAQAPKLTFPPLPQETDLYEEPSSFEEPENPEIFIGFSSSGSSFQGQGQDQGRGGTEDGNWVVILPREEIILTRDDLIRIPFSESEKSDRNFSPRNLEKKTIGQLLIYILQTRQSVPELVILLDQFPEIFDLVVQLD